jgi:protein-disulfide isomerase
MKIRTALLFLFLALTMRAEVPNGTAVLATIDGEPVTRNELVASLPPDVRREYESKFQQLAESRAHAVRDVIGHRTIAREAAERHVSEADAIAAEYPSVAAELDPALRNEIATSEEDLYNAEKVFLQRLVEERKLARVAAARHLTSEELTRQIENSVGAVTPEDVQFQINYESNRRRAAAAGEAPEKQVERAIRNTRVDRRKRELIDALPRQPKVAYLLEPPRLQVSADDDPTRGPRDAPVHIVMFSDFQCPYCAQAEPVLARVRQIYGDKVAITFRDYPLPIHPLAMIAAKAANCAAKSGKYWEFHDALFASQTDLSRDRIREIAESLGLSMNDLASCFDAPATNLEIQHDVDDGRRLGVDSTPTFFVNGRMLSGSQTVDRLASVIDDELAPTGSR